MRKTLKDSKLILIKIGTNTLTRNKSVDIAYIRNIANQIAALKRKGKEVIIITSGAIGLGAKELSITKDTRDVQLRQAAAAAGQAILMNEYNNAFRKHNQKIAQILVTYDTFANRKIYLNLRNAITTLLKLGAIPIINENDVTAIDEITSSFGDNDKLSALVASKTEADLLIMLTDISGLYTGNPKKDKRAKLISTVEMITKDMENYCGKASVGGKGGMISKLEAAKIAMDSGVTMLIVNGREPNVLRRVISGEELGTIFMPKEKISNKKRWIRFSISQGSIVVDEGAKKALLNGKNLLPAGIRAVKGNFEIGKVVDIKANEKVFAKAIIDYSSDDLKKINGKHSNEIARILGYEGHDNITKRENLVLME